MTYMTYDSRHLHSPRSISSLPSRLSPPNTQQDQRERNRVTLRPCTSAPSTYPPAAYPPNYLVYQLGVPEMLPNSLEN